MILRTLQRSYLNGSTKQFLSVISADCTLMRHSRMISQCASATLTSLLFHDSLRGDQLDTSLSIARLGSGYPGWRRAQNSPMKQLAQNIISQARSYAYALRNLGRTKIYISRPPIVHCVSECDRSVEVGTCVRN
jgi:hypothetical protein